MDGREGKRAVAEVAGFRLFNSEKDERNIQKDIEQPKKLGRSRCDCV